MPDSHLSSHPNPPLVFITGASSGIGQALALAYYQRGCNLALVARRREPMQQWLQEQGLDPQRVLTYAANVDQIDSIGDAARQCLVQQGLPDVVIANAGISIGVDTAEREDLDVMQQVVTTNLLGLAYTFHPFLKPMRQRGTGSLVGITSVAGIRGLPGHGAYSASKSGAISFCESLRVELRGTGVTCVTIVPGYVATPLTQDNTYAMPFILSAQEFAQRALRVIDRRSSYSVIPWQMAGVAWLLKRLPNAIYDFAVAGRKRKHRHSEVASK